MHIPITLLVGGWLATLSLTFQSTQVLARVAQIESPITPCFPFNGAGFSGTYKPSVSRQNWWCPAKVQYGFMGFSYQLENANCYDVSNSYAKINADFQRMKNQFGATMVRIYAPGCRDASIWTTLLRAGIANNMAVLPQVWWGFGDQNLWKKTASSILSVLADPTLGPVAPYVFHSIAFGSEPIGDDVDGGSGQFAVDLKRFRNSVAPYGIPVTISEDWDRPGTMSNSTLTNSTGLGPVGQVIASEIDLVHVHIMPYYHPNLFLTAADVWPYFDTYIPFLQRNLPGKPILITETVWSSISGGSHDRGLGNPGENIGNFTLYWNTILSHCEYFKQHQVGWFVHTYDDTDETGLGMISGTDSNTVKMNFKPQIWPNCL